MLVRIFKELKLINVRKLHRDLETAGVPITGCDSNGNISYKPEATEEQKQQAATIVANHNPYDYVEFRLQEYPAIGDQLDLLYKFFTTEYSGTDKGTNMLAWLNNLQMVKDKWKKNYEDLSQEEKNIVDTHYSE